MNITVNDNRDSGTIKLINEYHVQTFVEVGTRHGDWARKLLENTQLKKLIAIDIEKKAEVNKVEEDFPHRFQFVKGDSLEVINQLEDNSIDFIHLDSNHTYEHVKKELPLYYKKVKPGGIFSGDDYLPNYYDIVDGSYGVDKAIEEFCLSNNLTFYLTGCSYTKISEMHLHAMNIVNELVKFKNGQRKEGLNVPMWWFIK